MRTTHIHVKQCGLTVALYGYTLRSIRLHAANSKAAVSLAVVSVSLHNF